MATPTNLERKKQEAIPITAYVLTFCIGIIGSNSLMLGPIAPVVAISFGSSVPDVMLASSAFGLGTCLSALFLARYIDIFGAFRSIKISMTIISLSVLLSATSPNLLTLITSQFFVGVFTGIAIPAIYVAASHIAPPSLERKTIGVVLVGWTLSLVAGVSFSSLIAENTSWRYAFLILSILNILSASVIHFITHEDTQVTNKTKTPLSTLNNKEIVHLLIICMATMTSFYGVYSFLGDFIFTKLKQPLSSNGVLSILYGLGFGSVAVFRGKLKAACEKMDLGVNLLLLSLSYSFMLFSESFFWISISITILGSINHIAVNNIITKLNIAGKNEKGSVMGLNSAVTYFSVFISSSILGVIYSNFGFKSIVLTAFLFCFSASIYNYLNTRLFKT